MRWRRGLPERVRREIWLRWGMASRWCPRQARIAAGRIAKERIEAGADLILALGGDGTLNELLPGVAHTNVPVGILPREPPMCWRASWASAATRCARPGISRVRAAADLAGRAALRSRMHANAISR